MRTIAALVAFAVVAALGVVPFGNFNAAPDPTTGINQATAELLRLVLVIAFVAYRPFGLEYAQTGRIESSIASQFSTRDHRR